MHPYKRKRRTRKDMFTLGGWLFADLLLGLAMLFAVANTVGKEPPTPTPTASPDYLATAESDLALEQQSNLATQEALQAEIDQGEVSAQQTAEAFAASATEQANAEATRQAMSEGERATADAEATEQAASVQQTIDAQATQQAASDQSAEDTNNELATTVAQATEAAEQFNAQATEQAEVAAVATENAESGANSVATVEAAQNSQATSEANAQNAQATSDASGTEVANAQGTAEASNQQAANAQATSQALDQQVQLNSLDPNAQVVTFSVDVNGIIAGDQTAIDNARTELERALAPYVNGSNCRIGFVNISSGAPDVAQGVQASQVIAGLIQEDFAMLLPEPTDGSSPQLASNAIAFTGSGSQGRVELQLFLSAGCQPSG